MKKISPSFRFLISVKRTWFSNPLCPLSTARVFFPPMGTEDDSKCPHALI